MVETQETGVVEKTVRVAARPETVFPFFTDPKKMAMWKGTEIDIDPRPGGLYRVNVNGRDVASGKYVEVTPNSKVVFTWGWEGKDQEVPPGASTVEVTLTPNPPKDTDGRREDSGRGWVRELQGRWPGVLG